VGTGLLAPPAAAPAPGPAPSAPAEPAPRPRPAWGRPALAALLAATAFLYLWSLNESGWANAYYSAAAQAASQSWKAFFFGSFDGASSITVDKAPLFLWPMGISARLFGVNSWAILVPQALEGVATVGVLYAAVRRWAGPAAGLIAGAVVALTPVAALMFRFNNPDSMLVLLLTLGAYAAVRAIEGGGTRWVVLVGVCVGLGFLAKMMQAFLVVPGFGLAYLVAAPGTLGRRIRQLLVAGAAMVVAGGWWVAIVSLWPASSRPYIGGSQDNSLLNLIFGYNGFGRLTGDEVGSVGGGPAGTSGRWGETGLYRLFDDRFGGQISWLLPTALIMLVVLLVLAWRAPRTDRVRAAALLWGGWLVVTGLAISLGQGIIHEYYTVALAPPIGALVGIGAVELWRRRDHVLARAALAGTIAVTGWWAYRLLLRSPGWHPGLGTVVLVGGIGAAIALAVAPAASRSLAAAIVAVGAVVAFAAPAAATWETVRTPHSGAIPLAAPAVTAVSRGLTTPQVRVPPGAALPGGRGPGGNFAGGPGGGPFPSTTPQIAAPAGGILSASEPSDALVATLFEHADDTWVAATVSANQAAGYQLATGEPVMAIGGFNGTDPAPTLAQFQRWVAEGKIGWFIARGRTFAGSTVGLSHSGEISAWVEQNFTATTVDGVTLYDLHVG
jgi:4-amino-4-deoxy-L-arabinose transferase-like glycosyltransferase